MYQKKVYSFMLLLSFLPWFGMPQQRGQDIVIGKYDRIHSKILKEDRLLLVSLPRGYDQSKDHYPVLYVLDGDEMSLAAATSTVTNLSYTHIHPMIIVAVANTRRERDMIPDNDAETFLHFLTGELFPHIKNNYRTIDYRILYGCSNSGLFALFALLENPDSFSAYICSSPTVGWSLETMKKKSALFSGQSVTGSRFLYIVSGKEDTHQKVIKNYPDYLSKLKGLGSTGLRLKNVLSSSGGHCPVEGLKLGLLSLFDGYAYPDEKRRKEGIGALKVYYKNLSERVGFQLKYPSLAVLGIGQRLLMQKKYPEAVEAFTVSVQQYPEYWESHFFLALAYFKNGDLDRAKRHFQRAVEIDPEGHRGMPEFFGHNEMFKKFKK